MAEGGCGAAIRSDVSARHRQCFSFSLCLCPVLCLSQIMTSSVRPQLGGLVIPCFCLCLCCLSQPTASRTRVALLLRSATMRRKYGCGFACAVSSRLNQTSSAQVKAVTRFWVSAVTCKPGGGVRHGMPGAEAVFLAAWHPARLPRHPHSFAFIKFDGALTQRSHTTAHGPCDSWCC